HLVDARRRGLRLLMFGSEHQKQRNRDNDKNQHDDSQALEHCADINIRPAGEIESNDHQLAKAPMTPAARPCGRAVTAPVEGRGARSRTFNVASNSGPSAAANSSAPPGPL